MTAYLYTKVPLCGASDVNYFYRYFETFDVVSEVAADDRVKMTQMMTECASQEERGDLSNG